MHDRNSKSQCRGSTKIVAILHATVGVEITEKLIAHFGGERIYFPRDLEHRRLLRNRCIVEAHDRGQSVNEIAHDFELSDRRVHELLKTTDMSAAN